MTCWLNGEFRDGPVGIDISDRGFLLGDGIFETMLVDRGVPAFLDAHLGRLRKAVDALAIRYDDSWNLDEIIHQLAFRNGLNEKTASARLTVTRGPGARGLVYDDNIASTALLTLASYSPPGAPAKLLISKYIRCERSIGARYKTINYLDNILARNEAVVSGFDDAIMLNSSGCVACASAANIFAIMPEGEIVTPPVFDGALPGIVRGILISEASRAGIQIKERSISPEELSGASLFLTNSLIGLRPAIMGNPALSEDSDKILRLQLLYEKILGEDTNRKVSGA